MALAPSVGAHPLPIPETPLPAHDGKLTIPTALIEAADLPLALDLNTLNRCNVSCVMCPPAIRYDNGATREKYYRLTVEEFRRLTTGVDLRSVHFVGAYAEPLLNKEIFELVRIAHEQGMFTAITSNAVVLVPQFARKLIEAGLDMLSISLHGAKKETAEWIMRRSSFERVLKNIRVLQEIKNQYATEKPDIHFNFVSQRDNVQEIPDFIGLAHDLGVRNVNIIHLIGGDEAVDKSANLINYPDLVVPKIQDAARRGKARCVNVIVSSAYEELLVTTDKMAVAAG